MVIPMVCGHCSSKVWEVFQNKAGGEGVRCKACEVVLLAPESGSDIVSIFFCSNCSKEDWEVYKTFGGKYRVRCQYCHKELFDEVIK